MTNAVLQMGTGVFVIVIVWMASLVAAMVLLRAAGSTKLGVIPIVLLALTITLVLVFFPRSPESPPPFTEMECFLLPEPIISELPGFPKQSTTFDILAKEQQPADMEASKRSRPEIEHSTSSNNLSCIVDTLFIGRYVLLAVASAVFLVAFFLLLPLHFLEPVHAKALRTH